MGNKKNYKYLLTDVNTGLFLRRFAKKNGGIKWALKKKRGYSYAMSTAIRIKQILEQQGRAIEIKKTVTKVVK